MSFLTLKTALEAYVLFSILDIRKCYPKFYVSRLTEWQKKGYLQKIARGYYTFTHTIQDEKDLYIIANKLYRPSYVSFETALTYYQLIPESVYQIVSVSTQKTKIFNTIVGTFSYHTVKPMLFFGYRIMVHHFQYFNIAEPEKALLDLLYIRSDLKNKNDFKELRLNIEPFQTQVNLPKIREYAKRFNNQNLCKRLETLLDSFKC